MVIYMFTNCIKKIILAAFLIYSFNMVAVNFNVVLPINPWTIGFVTIFDIPALAILLKIKMIGV